jgi:chemotaxis protein histidine kinase CheA
VDKTKRAKPASVTPAKLALIAVLAVVLVTVLYVQFGSSSSETATLAVGRPRHRPAIAPQPTAEPKPADNNQEQAASANEPRKRSGNSSNWQVTDLAKVVVYDPFALPALFPQRMKEVRDNQLAKAAAVKTDDSEADAAARAEALKQMTTQFDQLQREGVRVVMQQHDKFVALIGDRTIHVGDEIDGFTVVAIDANGVRVARDLKQ